MYVYRKLEARSRKHCCSRKAIRNTYSECVFVALVIQHAKRVRRILLSFVACLVLPYFSRLFHKRHNFREKVIEHKTCVLIICTISAWNISHSKIIQLDIINVNRYSCKVPGWVGIRYVANQNRPDGLWTFSSILLFNWHTGRFYGV